MARSARGPRPPPPRSRRARRTRWTLSTSCGATDSATVTAAPSSYSAPGSTRSARLGLARVLAAPMQHSRQASRAPSSKADSTACSDTGPPICTPEYQPGVGSRGSENRIWSPGATPVSKTIRNTTRMTMTVSASIR